MNITTGAQLAPYAKRLNIALPFDLNKFAHDDAPHFHAFLVAVWGYTLTDAQIDHAGELILAEPDLDIASHNANLYTLNVTRGA